MKKTPFLLLAILLLGTVSCHKEPAKVIAFGATKGMAISAYDSIMEYDDSHHPFLLDLNENGINDIKIETYYDGPLEIGEYQTLTLYCLNQQTEILADSVVKEAYTHNETSIDTVNGYIRTSQYSVYSTCEKTAEDDFITTTKLFEAFANDNNDLLDIDSHFSSGKTILFKENYDYSWGDSDEINQTIYTSHQKAIYDCWDFPTDVEKYIGFKITKDDESRLGWLKIKLIQSWDNGPVHVKLIETAIQE